MRKTFFFLIGVSVFIYSCSLLQAPLPEDEPVAETPKNIIGKLKSRIIYPDLNSQTVIDEWGYEYDSTGRLKQQTRYEPNSFPKRVLNYVTYKYDSSNRVTNSQFFSRNINAATGFSVTEETAYRYSRDSLSLLLSRIVSNTSNNTTRTFSFTYNGRRLVRMTNPALTPPGYVTFEYNSAGNKTRENRHSSLNLIYEYSTFTYSSADTLLARSTIFDPDNTARVITTYQYDVQKRRTLEDVRQQKLATNQSNVVIRYTYYE
jgi:hypothetical protein